MSAVLPHNEPVRIDAMSFEPIDRYQWPATTIVGNMHVTDD
jgi:hypothetical protein